MNTKLIHITPNTEELIAYCARVSSPDQTNSNIDRLIAYCIKNKHWSIFEMGNMCVEVETSRALSAQILRHWSFSLQEFSQRYAKVTKFELYKARRQDTKDRQNSIDDMSEEDIQWFYNAQRQIQALATQLYKEALERQIAKEQARFLLPISASTKLYMNASIRDWIHYLELRTGNGTQLEHKEIAESIKSIFIEQLPTISLALGWKAA